MSLRKVVFWLHLACGLIAGLSIGVMCVTGVALAFEKELIAWAERDARRLEAPGASAVRLPLEELQRRMRETRPDARPNSIVWHNDPKVAVAFSSGRTGNFYANPYTGEIRAPKSDAMGKLMQELLEWHRYLNFTAETTRPRGKLVNGICNIAFCVLALTGLYLWMPRAWSWRALRPAVWFTQNATSKARDWNWHNVIGFWSAPVLIVLTLTAMPISFRWAGNLIFTLTGTPQPAPGAPAGPGAAPSIDMSPPAPGTQPISLDALLAAVQREVPAWQTITWRIGSPSGGMRTGSAEGSSRAMPPGATSTGTAPWERNRDGARPPQPVSFTVRESGSWPRTATTTLALNPFNAEVLRRTGYGDQNAAQQVRSWTRFLHTGEALGKVGQAVAGLVSLGGCFLVYTGFALSWRRFFGKKTGST